MLKKILVLKKSTTLSRAYRCAFTVLGIKVTPATSGL